jgi:hypothetical protein
VIVSESNEKEHFLKAEEREKGLRPWEPIRFTFVAQLNDLIRGGKTVLGVDGDGGKPRGMG